MKSRDDTNVLQAELFRSHLEQIIDFKNPLVLLGQSMDWASFEEEFGRYYSPGQGRPALPIRLMVGLHYLKYAFNESDESVVERLLENPYWQYFCGFNHFAQELPLDSTSLVKWRQRVGESGVEQLLKQTLAEAKRRKLLSAKHGRRITLDTTVQEKNISYPTDAKLYHKMRLKLVRWARQTGIKLRQSYERLGKKAFMMQGRYRHARQTKRANRELKKLKTYLGRVLRDVQRKVKAHKQNFQGLLQLAQRVLDQQRQDKGKLYSLHEPDVQCISKGKAHKKYEFGCKAGFASTTQGNWIVGAKALEGNPYDGHTVAESLVQVKELTGLQLDKVYGDRGYRGHDAPTGVTVLLPGKRHKGLSAWEKQWLRRRSAIEPIIGHLKNNYRLRRNYLKGRLGDQLNVILAASAFNFRKLLLAAPQFQPIG